jgi:hypothetical protein
MEVPKEVRETTCRKIVHSALGIYESEVTPEQIAIVEKYAGHLLDSAYGFSVAGIARFVKQYLIQ